jgi:hypothetical protein
MAPEVCAVMAVTADDFRAPFANGAIVHQRPFGNAPELRCPPGPPMRRPRGTCAMHGWRGCAPIGTVEQRRAKTLLLK